MTVLVLTSRIDPSADSVIRELARRDVPVLRVDAADFPQRLALAATLGDGGWAGQLRTTEGGVDLAEVEAVYYRRPRAFGLADGMTEVERSWAREEAWFGFGGVIASLRGWLNHPAAIARAEYKPLQLATAARCGLAVPQTLITNDPGEARELTRRVGRAVYKPLSSRAVTEDGIERVVLTTEVDPASLDDSVGTTAHLFQARVDKAYDVRLTVVDDAFFAVAVHADSPAAGLDWRADYASLRYEVVETPPSVRRGAAAMLSHLGLRFGALDFAVDQEGTWWVLEVNPNGQWGWIAYHTGLPIAPAIADALCDPTHRKE